MSPARVVDALTAYDAALAGIATPTTADRVLAMRAALATVAPPVREHADCYYDTERNK